MKWTGCECKTKSMRADGTITKLEKADGMAGGGVPL